MKNLLAIDTATERCSVALRVGSAWHERSVDTPRGHADIVLSMVDEVLRESGVRLRELEGIAYGRGPGAFTGVRIAIGVVQGLGFGAELPTVGISDLAAVAQQAVGTGERILVCMDARMQEVYWAQYRRDADSNLVDNVGGEHLSDPDGIHIDPSMVDVIAGSALSAYPDLAARFRDTKAMAGLPRAKEILLLAEREFVAGRGQPAMNAQPVYLRDQVTFVKPG